MNCPNDKNKFGDILKELREINNITEESVNEELNYKIFSVADYESGKKEPEIKDIIKLADMFNVPVDYIVGHDYYADYGKLYNYD